LENNPLNRNRITFAVIVLFIGTSVVSAGINIIEMESISDGEHLIYSENNGRFIDDTETMSFGEFDVYHKFSNGTYSYYRIFNTSNGQIEKTGNDDYYFHGKSNKSIYVVKVSSPYAFHLENLTYLTDWKVITNKPISPGRVRQIFLTNKTWFVPLMSIEGTGPFYAGNLRYFHAQLGRFKYTYENRTLYNMSGRGWNEWMRYPLRLPLSPGTWYFVFTGAVFDLDQDEALLNISVWVNFSGNDLDISTSESGKVYGLWYGEFDANVILSKAHMFEMMLRGRTHFLINNTFMYTFLLEPKYHGFWRIKWITPDGIKKVNIIMKKGERYGDPDNYWDCYYGFGESGEYKLRTSYLDYVPNGDIPYAFPTYFIGVDAELP
jgi:hypothetical protein